MEVTVSRKHFEHEPATSQLIAVLETCQRDLGLEDAQLYYKFPLYKDSEGAVIESKVLLVSPQHGLLIFWTIEENSADPQGQGERSHSAAKALDKDFFGPFVSCLV